MTSPLCCETSPMHESSRIISNDTQSEIVVVIEPWAYSHPLSPGDSIRVVARAEQPGDWDVVEEPGNVIMFAWSGAVASISDNDTLIFDIDVPLPPLPPGI